MINSLNKKSLIFILIILCLLSSCTCNHYYASIYAMENDIQPPVIIVPDKSKFSQDIEVGTTFTVPAPEVYDNGELLENVNWKWSILAPNETVASQRTSANRTFTPSLIGTYVITYSAEDSAGNVNTSNEYKLNVVATQPPVIELIGEFDVSPVDWYYSQNIQPRIIIPKATAHDVNFPGGIFVDKPIIKNKNEQTIEVFEEDEYNWSFIPDIQGYYSIVYVANGKYLSNMKAYTIAVGDVENPTLTWVNEEQDMIQSAYVSESWIFRLDMINIEDNKSNIEGIINEILADGLTSSEMDELDNYVKISMANIYDGRIGYELVDNGFKFHFTRSCLHTFEITVYDEAGNYDSYYNTINIYADEEAPTLTWGEEGVVESCTQRSIWTFKFDMINATDNIVDFDCIISNALVGGLTYDDLNDMSNYIKIEMKYITGEVLDPIIFDNELNYQFMKAGTYVFAITLKDASGNEKVDEHLIQVLELPTYVIVFDTQGGSAIDPYVKFEGDQVDAPVNPTKSGYFFNGWYSDGVKFSFNTFKIMTARNFILVADWVKSVDESKKTEEGIQILGDGLLNPNWIITSNIVSDTKVNTEKLQNMYEGKEKILKTYDINILDEDSKVNPNRTITVSIDIDKKMAKKNLKVVYISDDGETITDMNAKIVDNKLVFETNHFSNYAIIEVNETNVLLIVLLCVMVAVLGTVVVLTFVIIKLKKLDNKHNNSKN